MCSMEIKEYSTNVCKNTKESRIGCSVCPLKNIDVKSVDNYSSNKPWLKRKCLKSNTMNTKFKNFEKSEISPTLILKPIIKECYCNNMEKMKKEIFPRLICSKHFKTPNLIDIDEDWLYDIVEFRRENWFDCHSNLFFDANSLQNIHPLHTFNKLLLNCNHLNDPILLNSTDCNKFNFENLWCENCNTMEKKLNVEKEVLKKNLQIKKTKLWSQSHKPWIPN